MFTEEQLKKYLENISPNREFIRFEFSSAEKFIIQIKCIIKKKESIELHKSNIDKWIKAFSMFTATIWTAQISYTKMKTVLFQKNCVCQPINYTKSKKDEAETVCKAQIKFEIKLIDETTDLNLFITIDFNHSHSVYTSTAFDETMSDTHKKFYDYFDNGFNATTSKTYHELYLIEKYGTRSSQYLADEDINPSINHIKCLIDNMQSKDIKRSFRDILEAKKAYINDSGGTLMYTKNPEIVVIITPLMKNVMMNNNLNCVLVDSSLVKIGLVVTMLYISNKIGALPIACVLHTAATESNFKGAFKMLKLTINTLVYNIFNPKIFIVNDLVEQKSALSKFFPESKIIASRWSICCEIWKWLCSDDLKIDHRRRNSLMFLFKSLIYASAHTAKTHYTKLLVSNYFDSKVELHKYIDYIWGRSNEWIVKDDFQLNLLMDISIRLIKEFFLRECRFFNIIMMIDVVSKLLENHLKAVINTYIDGMPKILHYTKFFHRSYTDCSNVEFVQIRLNEYLVQYQSSPNLYYHVKTDTICCDCPIGRQGRLCDHLGIIFNKDSVRTLNIPLLTNIEVDLLMRFVGLSNDKNIKCEIMEDEEFKEAIESTTDLEKNTVFLNKYQRDCDVERSEDTTVDQSEYDVTQKPHIYIFKKFKNNNIKAIRKAPDSVELKAADKLKNNNFICKRPGFKRKLCQIELHMNSLKNLKEQFLTLMNYFQNNPNDATTAAMEHVSQELAKVKPQINVENITSNVMKYKKRKHND
ncbi:unnamed protein product [Pieris macdunnoughi]|uniref:SWIM-type domain-containing protein n=1 Tax=Pieris macdunnoughi TaxID=345717 RepID=A0A821W9J0_9NEOP|nr:unnamed protein product [Pieris macdunnoughi]